MESQCHARMSFGDLETARLCRQGISKKKSTGVEQWISVADLEVGTEDDLVVGVLVVGRSLR